ncbi:hypothetical protein HMI54_006942, partial [Coelomomyces lativittatus]
MEQPWWTLKKKKKSTKSSPALSVNLGSSFFINNWLYIWAFKLIFLCRFVKDLKHCKLRLPLNLTSSYNGKALDQAWKEELLKTNASSAPPSILTALKKIYTKHYFLLSIWKILWGVFTWLGAYFILQEFLRHFSSTTSANPKYAQGHGWAAGLLISSLFSSIAIHQLYGECSKEGIRIKGALTVLVYKKALVLARVRGGAGEVINIVSSDISRVQDAVLNFHFLWTSMLETILILSLAFVILGHVAWTSLGIIVVLIPIQLYLGKWTSILQRESTEVTTQRVHIMSEILTAIKLIKFYAWEIPFSERIHAIRKREMELMKKTLLVKAINYTFVFATPVIIAIVALSIYQLVLGNLTSTISFTSLSVFNTLRYPLLMLPQAVKSFSGAMVSLDRLTKYLTQPEIHPIPKTPMDPHQPLAFEINQ